MSVIHRPVTHARACLHTHGAHTLARMSIQRRGDKRSRACLQKARRTNASVHVYIHKSVHPLLHIGLVPCPESTITITQDVPLGFSLSLSLTWLTWLFCRLSSYKHDLIDITTKNTPSFIMLPNFCCISWLWQIYACGEMKRNSSTSLIAGFFQPLPAAKVYPVPCSCL